MDSPEGTITEIYPLVQVGESENHGLILPTVSPTLTDDPPIPMDKDDTLGEDMEGIKTQNDVEGVYSGLPEGGNLQVRFLLSHLIGDHPIELL